MKVRFVLAGLMGSLVAAAPLSADLFRWLAFGDSITLGNYDTSTEGGGYPRRLSELLGCSPGICEVYNAGRAGEKTYQGVTRIDSVLDDEGPFDIMTLMEGTNDIFRELYSVETMVSNLGIIANKARARGTDTVMASVIWFHPGGEHGTSKDDEVEALRDGVAAVAEQNERYFVDIWDVLCPASHPDVHGHNQTQCFNRHYSDVCPGTPPPCGDNRGHPIGSGYTMMANAFYNGLLAAPVPGVAEPVDPVGTVDDDRPTFVWDREAPVGATWYHVVVEGAAGAVIDRWLEARIYCEIGSCSFRPFAAESLEDGDYTWRVLARNPAGAGAWSAATPFRVFLSGIFSDGFESGDTGAWISVP